MKRKPRLAADTDKLLRALNEAMVIGRDRARDEGHDVDAVLVRLGVVAFDELNFGDVAGIATDAKRLGLEPLATVAAEALDHFTLRTAHKEDDGKATRTN